MKGAVIVGSTDEQIPRSESVPGLTGFSAIISFAAAAFATRFRESLKPHSIGDESPPEWKGTS